MRDILLVVLDATRADHFLCDLPGATTYVNAYATACWTPPSAAAIMTGYAPHIARLRLEQEAGVLTLTEQLMAAGWRCEASRQLPSPRETGGAEVWDDLSIKDDDGMAERAMAIMAERGERRFVTLWMMGCHCPYDRFDKAARRRFRLNADWTVREVVRRGDTPMEGGDQPDYMPAIPDVTIEEVQYIRLMYAATAFCVCRRVERLWRAALDAGWNIIITADHGEALYEHGTLGHMHVWEENVRVPLAASIEGLSPGPVEALASHLDIAPTILALAGLEYQLPGYDLRALPEERQLCWQRGAWGMLPWRFGGVAKRGAGLTSCWTDESGIVPDASAAVNHYARLVMDVGAPEEQETRRQLEALGYVTSTTSG